jgi:hypothetical protein
MNQGTQGYSLTKKPRVENLMILSLLEITINGLDFLKALNNNVCYFSPKNVDWCIDW